MAKVKVDSYLQGLIEKRDAQNKAMHANPTYPSSGEFHALAIYEDAIKEYKKFRKESKKV